MMVYTWYLQKRAISAHRKRLNTPISNDALAVYLRDSINWLDSLEDAS